MKSLTHDKHERPEVEDSLRATIALTRDVNHNLGNVIRQTNALIWRQNVLIGICIVLLFILVLALVAIYSSQNTQELISRQMDLIQYHMKDLEGGRSVVGEELKELRESLDKFDGKMQCHPQK